MMRSVEEQIGAMVDTETAARNARDAEALVSLFHPDTMWPWPPNAEARDRPPRSVQGALGGDAPMLGGAAGSDGCGTTHRVPGALSGALPTGNKIT
jgi:hypothetical protein